jgi:hypothetical protein
MVHFNNVKFAVYTVTYDSDLGMNVLNAQPSLAYIEGHISDNMTVLERASTSSEQERIPRYKMNCRLNSVQSETITNGSIIYITHKRHPDSKAWYEVFDEEQYVVHIKSNSTAHGREFVLYMTRKDRV